MFGWTRATVGFRTRLHSGCRNITIVSNKSWSFEFKVSDKSLHAEYLLPQKLTSPRDAILDDFFGPIVEHVRSCPTELLSTSSTQSLRNILCTLQFLDDLKDQASKLLDEEMAMEAILLTTTNWRVMQGNDEELLRICAQRNLRDRAPAAATVAAGLVGPLAWIPGVLVINEVIMRRVDNYGALTKDPDTTLTSRLNLAKASFHHHIARMIYDRPRVITLDKLYDIPDDISAEDLERIFGDGSHGEHITGRATFE
eukprot:gnl/TRDRNA2_/TRDRNA2_204393_c0_seq1.p1 gnl/TRDRNA2_/TRDRNA2_204393_c0~~gnl/TRDRNA2_/TRDRNA2_204393_c0_seq1.p1  ORF type:complete len:255 (+),score=34.96 gnl/TRDRNA2_/TRDRNA2_204393_c0_seq1:50-814(+)